MMLSYLFMRKIYIVVAPYILQAGERNCSAIYLMTKQPRNTYATIHTDGACLGNPGPMGAGFTIEVDNVVYPYTQPLFSGTNNLAESLAVLCAVQKVWTHNATHVTVLSDSKLIVNHLKGEWKIKDPLLKQVYKEIRAWADCFKFFQITHIKREYNTHADMLSKQAAEQLQ